MKQLIKGDITPTTMLLFVDFNPVKTRFLKL